MTSIISHLDYCGSRLWVSMMRLTFRVFTLDLSAAIYPDISLSLLARDGRLKDRSID